MDKNILMISKGKGFMVNAIEENLQEAGYQISHISPTIEEMHAHQDDAAIYIFYLGKFVSEISEALVFLKDICMEKEKMLILVGNPDELSIAKEQIPETSISASFERPLDIKKLLAELDRLAMINDDNARKKNILLVDDDGTFLKMVKGWLSLKYRVTIVSSGAQALMYIADNTPDLILLDYDMPVTSGPQVLQMIRSETKVDSIPVIFLTGKGDRESVLKVLSLKPDGYLLKSMDRKALVASVDDFFEKRRYKTLHDQAGM